MQVAVIGGGSWGTTVAHLCAHNSPTAIWTRRDEVAESISTLHRNNRYLPDRDLHPSLSASTDLASVLAGADVVIVGVASVAFPTTLPAIEPHVAKDTPIVSLAKGLDWESGRRMSELITDVFPDNPVGTLSGPNLANEIMAGHGAASVLSFNDVSVAEELQALFTTDHFRVYTNPDTAGCELGGALKNVIAIAAGIADGLGSGDNTRAAIMTRGLAEITRLGVVMGGRPETFNGLTGMGDLVATCSSPQSRNRRVGNELGRGRALSDILDEMQHVAEGVRSAPVVTRLGRRLQVELPICDQVYEVIENGRSPHDAYRGLMHRPHQSEVDPT